MYIYSIPCNIGDINNISSRQIECAQLEFFFVTLVHHIIFDSLLFR